MAIPLKTMRDIRTLSGRVDQIAKPYMAYLRVTFLEIEKARKGHERAVALRRVGVLDARLRDIETEKAALFRALGQQEAPPLPASLRSPNRVTSSRRAGGITLRY